MEADVICLQETWYHQADALPCIPGYTFYFAGEGKGKGVAAFIKSHLVQKKRLLKVKRVGNQDLYQGQILYFEDMHLLNIYRPPNSTSARHLDQFVQALKDNIDPKQQVVICGDFNFNILREPKHRIAVVLKDLGFQQIVRQPTTIYGSCLDHVYLRSTFLHKYSLYYPYYTDHECVCLMLKKRVLNH